LKTTNADKHKFIEKPQMQKLVAANATPLRIQTAVDCDIRIAGIVIPISSTVIQNLTHDIIIVLDTLELVKAKLSVQSRTLDLYNGLVNIPLIQMSQCTTVVTVAKIKIPPHS
jgi:hypothetical protein